MQCSKVSDSVELLQEELQLGEVPFSHSVHVVATDLVEIEKRSFQLQFLSGARMVFHIQKAV